MEKFLAHRNETFFLSHLLRKEENKISSPHMCLSEEKKSEEKEQRSRQKARENNAACTLLMKCTTEDVTTET